MARIYILSVSGRPQQTFDGPGEVAKAVEDETGRKLRGRNNIVPKLAKLKPGDTATLEDGMTVTVQDKPGSPPDEATKSPVGGVEVPEQPTANTPPPREDEMSNDNEKPQEEEGQEQEQKDYTPADELDATDPAERVEAGKREAEAKGLEPADEGAGEKDGPQPTNFVPPGEYVPDPDRQ